MAEDRTPKVVSLTQPADEVPRVARRHHAGLEGLRRHASHSPTGDGSPAPHPASDVEIEAGEDNIHPPSLA